MFNKIKKDLTYLLINKLIMLDYIYFLLLSYEMYSYYSSAIFFYNSFYYTYKVSKFIYNIPKKFKKPPIKNDDEWTLLENDKVETIELVERNLQTTTS